MNTSVLSLPTNMVLSNKVRHSRKAAGRKKLYNAPVFLELFSHETWIIKLKL